MYPSHRGAGSRGFHSRDTRNTGHARSPTHTSSRWQMISSLVSNVTQWCKPHLIDRALPFRWRRHVRLAVTSSRAMKMAPSLCNSGLKVSTGSCRSILISRARSGSFKMSSECSKLRLTAGKASALPERALVDVAAWAHTTIVISFLSRPPPLGCSGVSYCQIKPCFEEDTSNPRNSVRNRSDTLRPCRDCRR